MSQMNNDDKIRSIEINVNTNSVVSLLKQGIDPVEYYSDLIKTEVRMLLQIVHQDNQLNIS